MMRRTFLIAPVLLVLSACSGQPEKEKKDIHLTGAGATFPTVLYREWFAKYEEAHNDVSIDYDSVGSGEGVKRFLGTSSEGGAVDFGASDNGLTKEEAARAERGVVQVPTTIGTICLAYNLPGIDDLKLSRETYTGIFLGSVKKWNDRLIRQDNPDITLPNIDISVVVRSDGSGTTYHFSNHLSAASKEWKEKHGTKRLIGWHTGVLRRRGNEGVGGEIKRSPGTIGYVDLGTKQKGELKAATLKNLNGDWVSPTPAGAKIAFQSAVIPADMRFFVPDPTDADAYPIVGLTYVMLHRDRTDPKRRDALKRLMEWCLVEGQDDCERLGYVSLPPNVAQRALKAVRSIGE